MSTVILQKDHDGHKKGERISVPFVAGKQLIADKIGVYPEQPKAVRKGVASQDALIAELRAKIAAMEAASESKRDEAKRE